MATAQQIERAANRIFRKQFPNKTVLRNLEAAGQKGLEEAVAANVPEARMRQGMMALYTNPAVLKGMRQEMHAAGADITEPEARAIATATVEGVLARYSKMRRARYGNKRSSRSSRRRRSR
jgi:hypothetical protein